MFVAAERFAVDCRVVGASCRAVSEWSRYRRVSLISTETLLDRKLTTAKSGRGQADPMRDPLAFWSTQQYGCVGGDTDFRQRRRSSARNPRRRLDGIEVPAWDNAPTSRRD